MRGRIVILLCLVFSFSVFKAFSQVDLKSGGATFSYPLFNWSDAISNLNMGMDLSYNSRNGLKVDDVASNVGQGWNLNAGGSIIRIQVGQPDDQMLNEDPKIPAGYLYNTKSIESGVPVNMHTYPIYKNTGTRYFNHLAVDADRELDYFIMDVNGMSAKFVLEKNSNEGRLLGEQNIKIYFETNQVSHINDGIRTAITKFLVKNLKKGLEYTFDKLELTKLMDVAYSDARFVIRMPQPYFSNSQVEGKATYRSYFDNLISRPWIVSGWHLTSIRDLTVNNQLHKISLIYEERNINAFAGYDAQAMETQKLGVITKRLSIVKRPVLSQVLFPDNHKVFFNYNENRLDYKGDKILSQIDINYGTDVLSRYKLEHNYVLGSSYVKTVKYYQDEVKSRLFLIKVKKYSYKLKDVEEPIEFDYYLGGSEEDDIVPPSFSVYKDVWGYYNGFNAIGGNVPYIVYPGGITMWPTFEPFLETNYFISYGYIKDVLCFKGGTRISPKTGYAKNGLLKSIINPQGNKLTYEYTQRMYKQLPSQYSTDNQYGGVSVSKTILVDLNSADGCLNPMITNYEYKMENGDASLWGVDPIVNHLSSTDIYQKEDLKWNALSCNPFQYPGILNGYYMNPNLSFGHNNKFNFSIGSFVITLKETKSIYAAVAVQILGYVMQSIDKCSGDISTTNTKTYYNYNLSDFNPLPNFYKRVEVKINTGDYGKVVHELTDDNDFSLWISNNPAFNMQQRYADWVYGLPKRTLYLDKLGNRVKEVINTYSDLYSKGDSPSPLNGAKVNLSTNSLQVSIKKSRSKRNTTWEAEATTLYNTAAGYTNVSNENYDLNYYSVYTGWVGLYESKERVYSRENVNEFVESKKTYSYYPEGHILKSVKVSTHGFDNVEEFTYVGATNVIPTELNTTSNLSAIATIQSYELIGMPLSKKSMITHMGAYVNEPKWVEYFEYKTNESGRILLQASHEKLRASPVLAKKVSYNYDNNSRLISTQTEGGRKISYIYGHNKKIVVANIITADITKSSAAYTSFEDITDQSELGGWLITGNVTINSGTGITGSKYLTLTSANSIGINTLKQGRYILSFWSTASLNVSSGTNTFSPLKVGPVKKGYTYYEYSLDLSNVTTGGLKINGTGNIDELRFYPGNSRMGTSTFIHGLGITAECDMNNRITYKEYDNMGRLKTIKDIDNNIVKAYDYNLQKVKPVCPVTYSSRALTLYAYKDNCPSGYVGSAVVYRVLPGSYQSSISQYDADIKAYYEYVKYSQDFANTNGTCLQSYSNDLKSKTFYKEDCNASLGFVPNPYVYTVPAGKYVASSKDAANKAAEDEIEVSGQIAANNYGTCATTNVAIWEAEENASERCKVVNGSMNGEYEKEFTNVNPNSSTFNQKQWLVITKPSSVTCGTPVCSNCSGEGFRCVNGICELGIAVYTGKQIIGGQHYCTYYYIWSDMYMSDPYLIPVNPSLECLTSQIEP